MTSLLADYHERIQLPCGRGQEREVAWLGNQLSMIISVDDRYYGGCVSGSAKMENDGINMHTMVSKLMFGLAVSMYVHI